MYNNGRKGLITLARDAEYPIRFQRWPIKTHNPYHVLKQIAFCSLQESRSIMEVKVYYTIVA